jgi:hypothetical protein
MLSKPTLVENFRKKFVCLVVCPVLNPFAQENAEKIFAVANILQSLNFNLKIKNENSFFFSLHYFVSTVVSSNCVKIDGRTMGDVDKICLPLRDYDEAVVLDPNYLPDDVNEIISILQYEEVKLDIWIQIAVAYYHKHKIDQFVKILNAGANQSMYRTDNELKITKSNQFYQDYGDTFDKIAIFNTIAAYYIELAKSSTEKEKLTSIKEAGFYLQKVRYLNFNISSQNNQKDIEAKIVSLNSKLNNTIRLKN